MPRHNPDCGCGSCPKRNPARMRRPSRGNVVAFVLGGGLAMLGAHEACRWLMHQLQRKGYRFDEHVYRPDGTELPVRR